MNERRDALVNALKRAGIQNPTDDDIDTAGGQLDHLCDPVTGTPRGSLDAACDEAVVMGEKAKRDLKEKRAKDKAEKGRGKTT